MKFSRIKMGRQGNFILGLLLIFFVFFGYISNQFPRDDSTNLLPIGQELIFLYQILFDPGSFLSLIILFGIMFIVALRESFFEFAIRNSIWYIPAILMMSWFWYWFLFGFDATVFYIYFIRIEGYITILALLSINLLATISASVLNEKRKELKESKY